MTERITRRDFIADSLFLGLASVLPIARIPGASAAETFISGVNYPWVAYGHDFGRNGWGYDGLSTGGWTYQTYPDSQGFVDVRRTTEKSHSGRYSLRVDANLLGGHPNRSKGEVYVSIEAHPPRGSASPLNLEGGGFECWLFFPPGASGDPHAPNGIQMFLKSKIGDNWYSWYSYWQNILSSWEGRWIQISISLSDPPGYSDAQFDPRHVIAAGVKVGVNSYSSAALQGPIYLDDVVFRTDSAASYDFEKAEVEVDFSLIRQALCEYRNPVVRVFVLADGRASPDFESDGTVIGLDTDFFRDFDLLVETARQNAILLMPVLLDFHWCDIASVVSGVQQGGHADIIRDPTKRQAFVDRVLKPFLARYATHPAIYAIDVINEPEWAMREVPKDWQIGDPVSVAEMQEFVRLCVQEIHQSSTHKVTVGSARARWLPYWRNLGLDVYQFHWYDKFAKDGENFPWPPCGELQLDKPCIIGEVATKSTGYSPQEYLRAAMSGGYAGLLFWSYRARDEFSAWPQNLSATLMSCGSLDRPAWRHALGPR